MSFVVILSVGLGLIAGGASWLLFRRRAWVPLAIGIVVFAGCMIWALTPVCRAIADDDLVSFDPPIDTRTDTGMTGQRYFQKRDGKWFHCKTRIARKMFF